METATLLLLSIVAARIDPLDSQHASMALNAWFTGPVSKSGVYLRQMSDWELWCDGICYGGRADCTLSSSFFNLAIGTNQSKFIGEFPFDPGAGVVFNTTTAQMQLARCYQAFDAQTWSRYNGGCGCTAEKPDLNCASPHSPFKNVGPDDKFVDGGSPYAESCRCKSDQDANGCFWRGPAYNTSSGPFGSDEVGHFVAQRLRLAKAPWTWDDIVIDGRGLQSMLASDPVLAITAVFYLHDSRYPKNTATNIKIAQQIQGTFSAKYQVLPPLVMINQSATVSTSAGPFFEHQSESHVSMIPSSKSVVV